MGTLRLLCKVKAGLNANVAWLHAHIDSGTQCRRWYFTLLVEGFGMLQMLQLIRAKQNDDWG